MRAVWKKWRLPDKTGWNSDFCAPPRRNTYWTKQNNDPVREWVTRQFRHSIYRGLHSARSLQSSQLFDSWIYYLLGAESTWFRYLNDWLALEIINLFGSKAVASCCDLNGPFPARMIRMWEDSAKWTIRLLERQSLPGGGPTASGRDSKREMTCQTLFFA